jgi:hypothetical protein
MCNGTSCVAVPVCGDGVCNGAESSANCCRDCGCAGGQSCQNNACVCTAGTLHIVNTMPDNANFCIDANQSYTQLSTAYISTGGQLYFLPAGGFVDLTDPPGTVESGTVQCCYRDACVGNLSCKTPVGPEPCVCLTPQPWSQQIAGCTTRELHACGN